MLSNGVGKIKKVDVWINDSCFESLCAGAREVLKRVQEWPLDQVKFELFKDGITNHLLKCYMEDDPDDAILIRVYGKKTELFIDRSQEVWNMQTMCDSGQAAPLYCSFNNGLCYGYSPGVVLDSEMVRDPSISRLIAQRLADMHSIKRQVNGAVLQPSLFTVFKKYLELLPQSFSDLAKNERFLDIIPSKQILEEELNLLKEHLVSLDSPVVFCHNDLLLKNIVYNEEKGEVTFIDYEYASYNYQGFDIGNHFCEFAGVEKFEPHLYPSKDFQLRWLRYYLETFYSLNGWTRDITDEDVECLYVQVTKFALAAQLFWGMWALIQAAHSTLDFDFLGYSSERISEYFARKDEFLSIDSPQNV